MNPEPQPLQVRTGDPLRITPQMGVILVGLARGESTKDTGDRLFLSAATIKTHRRRLYKVLGARNAAHAVSIGFRTGLLHTKAGGDPTCER